MNHPTSHAPGFFHRFGWSSAGLAGALMLAANVQPAAAQIITYGSIGIGVEEPSDHTIGYFNVLTGQSAMGSAPAFSYDFVVNVYGWASSYPGRFPTVAGGNA